MAQHRFARGTFSDDTALFLHGMTDRALFSLICAEQRYVLSKDTVLPFGYFPAHNAA